MATINMLVGQSVVLNALPTLSGIEATIVGTPVWTTSDATKIGLAPSADGRSCRVYAKDTGAPTVTCAALGAAPINATHTISIAAVSSALATALAVTMKSPPA